MRSLDPLPWLARLANGYKNWLKDLNRESFSGVMTQFLWAFGSVVFTLVAAILMLDEGVKNESHHQWGFQIITALLIAWGMKTGANVVSDRQKQRSNVPFVEAQERGKATGAALATVITERAADVKQARQVPTAEHPAASAVAESTEENQWATGDAKAGLL